MMNEDDQIELRELLKTQKTLRTRLQKPQGAKETVWAMVSGFGLLALGGGLINLISNGLNETNGLFIALGGLSTYRWHAQDLQRKHDKEELAGISHEICELERKTSH